MTTDQLQNEYEKAICERDAAWDSYCRYPNDETWEYFSEMDRYEKVLKQRLGEVNP